MKISLALLLSSLLMFNVLADSLQLADSELHLRRFSVRDGLPSAYINTILQRQDGFIWLGSKGGLSRFDGQRFNNMHISTETGLISNDVLSLVEDQQQRLWVGTARGLFLFDDYRQQFQHIPLAAQAPTILSLFQHPLLGLWAGTDKGLFQLTADDNSPHGVKAVHYGAELEVKVMLGFAGQLWLGTKQGLFVLDLADVTPQLTHVPLKGTADIEVRQQRIFDAIIVDKHFYIATDRDGLLLFDPAQQQVLQQWLRRDQLSGNSIWSLVQHDQQLWLGYFFDGISRLSLIDGSLQHYQHHAQIQYSLPHNNISQLLVDKQQQLWMATTNGLAVTNLADQAIRHLGEYQQISDKHVWSMAQHGDQLWFGSENGLNKFDLSRHQLQVYHSSEHAGLLPRTVIWSMQPLDDELLLATNEGLLAFNTDTAAVRRWPAPPRQQTNLPTPAYSLRQHQQQLLIGYYDSYFAVYDLSSQQYVQHKQLDGVEYITDMLPVQQGYLLATDNGLFQLADDQLLPLTLWLPKLAAQALHVTSLLAVGEQIWATTQDNGLLILQQHSTEWHLVQQLTQRDGLAENQLRSLALDTAGQVWVTGMKTLSQLDPDTLSIRRLSRHLHWLDMEFHANATLRQTGSILAFGGNQGIIFFDARALPQQHEFPKVHLTSAQIMTDRVVVHDNQLIIPSDASYYAFQFSALEYLNPERIHYQYQLTPLLNDWQPMLSNQLSLSRLPYGSYQLKVRSTNAEGVWNPHSTDIQLTLSAPWYFSSLAKWLYAILSAVLILLLLWWLIWRFSALKQVANHDSLTQLPNRRYFNAELKQRLLQCRSQQQQLALMFFDLNHFKQLNDSCGHDIGDKLLIQVATRLQQAIRNTDFAARLAGDEFVVILSHIQQQSELNTTVERISQSLSQPYQLGLPTPLQLSCSIGISVFNRTNPVTAEELLQQADQAMYLSKQQHHAWCYYQDTALQAGKKQHS